MYQIKANYLLNDINIFRISKIHFFFLNGPKIAKIRHFSVILENIFGGPLSSFMCHPYISIRANKVITYSESP